MGYELVEVTATETDGFVELCVEIMSHDGAPRPFTLSATTQDGTAGVCGVCNVCTCFNSL